MFPKSDVKWQHCFLLNNLFNTTVSYLDQVSSRALDWCLWVDFAKICITNACHFNAILYKQLKLKYRSRILKWIKDFRLTFSRLWVQSYSGYNIVFLSEKLFYIVSICKVVWDRGMRKPMIDQCLACTGKDRKGFIIHTLKVIKTEPNTKGILSNP